ncbi:hypothetical protein TcasGA2_TC014111 [Tribolium castaneum]|uniref:Kinesin motor domain-containing protein n=1 Tax=Tribolium castaneum TaxID=7070 RepID=D6WKA3_TRICA|nr:hypothetical protein TcasGA2_TC014111 [Tribolium castaneum]
MSTNIQVAIRIRPLIASEEAKKLQVQWGTQKNNIFQIDDNGQKFGDVFSFDHIFGVDKTNTDIYDNIVKDFVESSLNGLNSTIFAYGQTSSGKTYTMLGDKKHRGIMSLAIENIFEHIENSTDRKFLIRVSYIEIYNEKIYDLLDPSNKEVKIREFFPATIGLQNIKEEIVTSRKQMYECLRTGTLNRHIAGTKANDRSSRSHTIFKITIESTQVSDFTSGPVQVSSLNLVDLAGSERVAQTKATGVRLKEGSHINKSLSALGLVIRQLSDGQEFINFRDSKLTRLLQDSLGGNSKTLIIATITLASIEDTCSTLAFAQRAKAVKNKPHVNEILTDADLSKRYASLNSQLQKKLEEQLRINQKLQETQEVNVREMSRLQQQMELIEHFQRGKISEIPSIPKRRHTIGFATPMPLSSIVFKPDCDTSNQDPHSLLFLDEFSSKDHTALGNTLETIVEEDFITPMKRNLEKQRRSSYSSVCSEFPVEDNDALKKITELEEEIYNEKQKQQECEIQLKELNDKFKLREEDLCNKILELEKKLENENSDNFYSTIIGFKDQLLYLQQILSNEKIETEFSNSYSEKDLTNKSYSLELSEVKECDELHLELMDKEQEERKCLSILEENEKLKMELIHYETKNKFLTDELDRLTTEIKQKHTLKNSNEMELTLDEYELKQDYIKLKNEFTASCTENEFLQKSNEEMKRKIEKYDSLKQEYIQLKNDLTTSRTENDSLLKLIEEMKGRIEEYHSLNIQLQNKLKMNRKTEEYDSLSQQYIQLKNELTSSSTEKEFLLKSNEEMRRRIEEYELLEQQYIQFKNEFTTLCTENDALQNSVEEMKRGIEEYQSLKSEYIQLQDEFNAFCSEKESLKKSNEEMKKRTEEYELLKQQYIQLKNEFNASCTEKDSLQKLNEEIKRIVEENESLKQEYIQLNNKFNASCTEKDSLQKSNEEMKRKIEENESLKEEYVQLKNEFSATCREKESLQKLNEEIKRRIEESESLKQEYIQLKNKFDASCTEKDSLQKSNEEMKRKIEENESLKEEYVQLKNEFSTTCREKESLHKLNEEIKRKIEESESLKQEYIQLKNKFNASCTEKDSLLKSNEEMKRKIEENESLKQEYAQLKNELSASCREKESLQKLIEESKREVEESESLKQEHIQLKIKFNDLCAEKDSWQKSNEEMKRKIEENESLKEEYIQLKNEFSATCREKESLHKLNEKIKRKIEESESLKQEYIEFKNKFTALCTEKDSLLKLEYAQLKNEFKVSCTEKDSLKKSNEEMRMIIEEQKKKIENMKICNDKLNLEIRNKETNSKEQLCTMSSQNNYLKNELEKLKNEVADQKRIISANKEKLHCNDLELQKQKRRLLEGEEHVKELEYKIRQSSEKESNFRTIIEAQNVTIDKLNLKYRNILGSIMEYFISEQKSLLLIRHSQDERENFKSIIRDLKTNNATLKSQVEQLRNENNCDLCAIQETIKKSHLIFKDYFSLEKTFLKAQIIDLENTNEEYLKEMMALKDQQRNDSTEDCSNCDKLQNEITRLTEVATSQDKLVVTLEKENSTLRKERFESVKQVVHLQQQIFDEQDKKSELQYTEWMKFLQDNNKLQQQEIRELKRKIKKYENMHSRSVNKQSVGTECNLLGAPATEIDKSKNVRVEDVQNGCLHFSGKISTIHAEVQCNIFSEPSALQEKYDLLKQIYRKKNNEIQSLNAEINQLKLKVSSL